MLSLTYGTLIHLLQVRDSVTSAERAAIEALPFRAQECAKGDQIIAQHSRPTESCILTRGLTARTNEMRDGSRQITAINLAGDFVDLPAMLLKVMDHGVVALSDCRLLFVAHSDLRELMAKMPHLARLLWLTMIIDGAIGRAWLVCLGRRSASQHLAHLLCEIYLRMKMVGLAQDENFHFPIAQHELADMLGITAVHANRTLQILRAKDFLTWINGIVALTDFDRLAEYAEFDATYLNMIMQPR